MELVKYGDSRNRQGQGRHDGESSGDSPVYSRLFVIGDKKLMNQDAMSEAFSSFGHIQYIKLPKNSDGEPKGVCFIKFSKTSEAANALEAMHMKTMPNTQRPMKVLVAVNPSEVERSDDDEEKYKRLFIHVPRRMKEEEIEKLFGEYGRLSSVVVQRDHHSGESKGFAYVTYSKFSEAARAFEECSRQYRPVFAKPKFQKRPKTSFESNMGILASSSSSHNSSLISMMANESGRRGAGFTRIHFMCCSQVAPIEMERLFDLIPGMDDFRIYPDIALNCYKGYVSYSNPNSASYAVFKLNNFEYPPGMKIFVKPDKSSFGADANHYKNVSGVTSRLKAAIMSSKQGTPDMVQLADAIAEASKLIKQATGDSVENQIPDSNNINYCSVKLPPPQPLADMDSNVAKRCFLVCKPAPPPLTVLRDIFCRFGDLINVYTLPNKTVGFARYASVEAADSAIKTLHGAEVCGVRMKVIEAEEETDPKKRRYDDVMD